MIALKKVQGWVFDLDGVIWAGKLALPGAVDLVAELRRAGRSVLFLSNNSGATAEQLAGRLTALGIPASPGDLVSPVAAAGQYLRERCGAVRVLVSGVPALADGLRAAGHTLVTDPLAAEAVVMGRDPAFTYETLALLSRAVDRGVPFLALNRDLRMPVEGGVWVPGLGALVAAVEAATGREAELVGKPHPLLFRTALAHLGLAPYEVVMIGDTPAADIAGGLAAGMWTVLVGGATAAPEAHLRVSDPAELLGRWQGFFR
jgi:HAD superfamily hydrolase (TIGR01450 family)